MAQTDLNNTERNGLDDVSAACVLRLPAGQPLEPGQKVASIVRSRPSQLMLGVVQPDGASVLWLKMVDTAGVISLYPQQQLKPGNPVAVRGDEFPCPPEYAELIG
jgi:hypothetical protein